METEKRYPYATVELTERCNIRCKHCYFFKDERGRLKDLPDQEFLTRLAELQRRYGIKAMSWAGGEPLLRQ
jgi:MoaA/NifB/PqqE/SkfB family radical SAM enzyme